MLLFSNFIWYFKFQEKRKTGKLIKGHHLPYFKDSTDFVGALAVYIAYSMITAGRLPLVMPVLWLSMLSTTLLAAVSWHEGRLHHTFQAQDGRLIF